MKSVGHSKLGRVIALTVVAAGLLLGARVAHAGTWTKRERYSGVPGTIPPQPLSVAVDPNNASVAYAGLTGQYAEGSTLMWDGYIIKTTDAGLTWSLGNVYGGSPACSVIAVAPGNSGMAYAGCGTHLEKTANGISWTGWDWETTIHALAVDSFDEVLLGDDDGLWASFNLDADLFLHILEGDHVYAVSVLGNSAVAQAAYTLYFLSDPNAAWIRIGPDAPQSILTHSFQGLTSLYVGLFDTPSVRWASPLVLVLPGAWFDWSNGLPNDTVRVLARRPGGDTTLYAGTYASGVFSSSIGLPFGDWTPMNEGLPYSYRQVTQLVAGTNTGDPLYAIVNADLYTYLPNCGNGTRDPGEQCDDGGNNGTPGDCCAIDCQANTGSSCNDGNACTYNDSCNANGMCAGTAITCTSDQCNTRACNGTASCTVVPKGGQLCDDGVSCTYNDTCNSSGACVGTSITCTDDQCNTRVCNGTPSCTVTPKTGQPCNDGRDCTYNDTCNSSGVCVGTTITCLPPDQCHSSTCNGTSSCTVTPLTGTSCEDGNPCTVNDTCQSGSCQSGPQKLCAALDQCHIAGTCNPTTGQCSNPNQPDGTSCQDGSACTVGDTCQNGQCAPGKVTSCIDGDPCTVDSCDPATGACHYAQQANCQRTQAGEALVGGGQHDCGCRGGSNKGKTCSSDVDCPTSTCPYDPVANTCTVSTPGVDLTIPVGALSTPTYINVTTTPLSGTTGPCSFALENTRNQVATCVQLEPSGTTQFTTPVTATFKWTNPPTAACNVSAVTPTGATTTVKEGTLSVYTQRTCVAGKCDTTGTACMTDANCGVTALTDPCGKAGYTTSCPVCPGTGCPAKATLDYPTCTSPCTTANIDASCNPGANTWTVQLTHFSPYALGSLAPPPDPFQCYRTVVLNTTAGAAAVSLADHFGTLATTVRQPRSLCAPTNANGQNPEAPAHADYLQSYALKDSRARAQFTPYAPRRNQQVLDQFGTHKLDLTSPDRLLVPTAENLTSQPDPLASTFVDHFTCYGVKASRGSSRFQPVELTVTDAFALAPQRIKVQRPSRLCVPTDKNGEAIGAENNPWQLLCYHATRTFKQIGGVQTTNELGSSSVYPWAREEFCVPARIQ